MKLKQSIPLSLLLDVEHHNALYLWLRINACARKTGQRMYDNTVYNCSYAKIASLTGISKTSVHTHLKEIIALGWAYKDAKGHLRMRGLNTYKSQLVLIPVEHSKKAQIRQFRNAIVTQKINHIEKQVSSKKTIVQLAKKPHGKLSKKQLKTLRKNPSIVLHIDEANLSNKKFGTLINRSKSTGYRLQRDLNKHGHIISKPRYKVILAGANYQEYIYYRMDNLVVGLRYIPTIGIVQQRSNKIALV